MSNEIQLQLIRYSITDLNVFRLKKRDLRKVITGDLSLVNVFKEIDKFATNPANKHLKSIPKKVLEEVISNSNKYREEVLKFDVVKSDISDFATFQAAMEVAMTEHRVEEIKRSTDLIIQYVETGDAEKAKYQVDSLHKSINSSVEIISQDQIEHDLSQYYTNVASERTTTGFKYLDKQVDGGILKGQILTIAGESGIGKTWVATNYIVRLLEANQRICLLSNEMTRVEMFNRLLAVFRELPESEIERQGWGDEEGKGKENKEFITAMYNDLKIYERCHNLYYIEAVVEKMASEHGIWLFVLDHFHNLTHLKKGDFESQAHLAHELQRIAQQYQVSFILFSQLAKNDYGNKNASPKGAGELIDVSNFIFTLTFNKDDQNLRNQITQQAYVRNSNQKIITVTANKIRRGKKGTVYWLQDFERGGIIEEVQKI